MMFTANAITWRVPAVGPRVAVIDLRRCVGVPRPRDIVRIDGMRCRVVSVEQPRTSDGAYPIIGVRVVIL